MVQAQLEKRVAALLKRLENQGKLERGKEALARRLETLRIRVRQGRAVVVHRLRRSRLGVRSMVKGMKNRIMRKKTKTKKGRPTADASAPHTGDAGSDSGSDRSDADGGVEESKASLSDAVPEFSECCVSRGLCVVQ